MRLKQQKIQTPSGIGYILQINDDIWGNWGMVDAKFLARYRCHNTGVACTIDFIFLLPNCYFLMIYGHFVLYYTCFVRCYKRLLLCLCFYILSSYLYIYIYIRKYCSVFICIINFSATFSTHCLMWNSNEKSFDSVICRHFSPLYLRVSCQGEWRKTSCMKKQVMI